MNQPQKVLKIRVMTNTKPQMRIHSSVLKMLMPPLCVVHRYSGMMTGKPYSSRLLMIRMMAQMRILRLVTRMVAPSASSLSCSLRFKPSPLTTLFFGTKKKHMSVPTMENGRSEPEGLVFADDRHDEARQDKRRTRRCPARSRSRRSRLPKRVAMAKSTEPSARRKL